MAYLLHIGRVHEGCFWEPWNSERRMEDSNLQVVSDRMPSKHLQCLYGNAACQRCVFTELSPLIKQVPWFFMCIPTTVLTFGYSLSLPVLRKDTGLSFTLYVRLTINNDILTEPISESAKPTETCDVPLFSFPLVGGESSHGRIYETKY